MATIIVFAQLRMQTFSIKCVDGDMTAPVSFNINAQALWPICTWRAGQRISQKAMMAIGLYTKCYRRCGADIFRKALYGWHICYSRVLLSTPIISRCNFSSAGNTIAKISINALEGLRKYYY